MNNDMRAEKIREAIIANNGKWPEQLESGIMFWKGERITKSEFETSPLSSKVEPAPSNMDMREDKLLNEFREIIAKRGWQCRDMTDELVAAALSNTSPALDATPEGWRLVPIEPTMEMKRALFINLANADDEAMVIKAIIAAAPPAPTQEQKAADSEWEKLKDPNILHINLLRGIPAILSFEQKVHLLGEHGVQELIASRLPQATKPAQDPIYQVTDDGIEWRDLPTVEEFSGYGVLELNWKRVVFTAPQPANALPHITRERLIELIGESLTLTDAEFADLILAELQWRQ